MTEEERLRKRVAELERRLHLTNDSIKALHRRAIEGQLSAQSSVAKYKEMGEIELTCFYSGHAQVYGELVKNLPDLFPNALPKASKK